MPPPPTEEGADVGLELSELCQQITQVQMPYCGNRGNCGNRGDRGNRGNCSNLGNRCNLGNRWLIWP